MQRLVLLSDLAFKQIGRNPFGKNAHGDDSGYTPGSATPRESQSPPSVPRQVPRTPNSDQGRPWHRGEKVFEEGERPLSAWFGRVDLRDRRNASDDYLRVLPLTNYV
jgi:hypothetical protein